MSDVVTLARTARESLARGLNALQGDPQVPPQLLELAAPIAQAMGALHHIERSGGAHGDDIVEHGGLFVSTYKLPKIGQPVRLKVALRYVRNREPMFHDDL